MHKPAEFLDIIQEYQALAPLSGQEDITLLVEHIDNTPDWAVRHRYDGAVNVTAGALVVSSDQTKVLLMHHQKFDRWTQFGGHLDGDENIYQSVRREVAEESGLAEVEFASQYPLEVYAYRYTADEFPYACTMLDTCFLLIADESQPLMLNDEAKDLKWLTWEQALELSKTTNSPDTLRVLNKSHIKLFDKKLDTGIEKEPMR